MQKVSCPGCGAPVQFQSPASVMAVCEYCKTTVLKDADTVKDLGRMADVLDDYSPIQIGTSGRFGNQEFTVVGRIQLRYEAGLWNEWYVLFADGRDAWLSGGSGLFTLTFRKQTDGPLPAFRDINPGNTYALLGQHWLTAETRIAQCTGGQGELPFRVGPGWQAKVADFRNGRAFLTLDYSDGDPPAVYIGQAVTLAELKCQLLRDDDAIRDSAGKVKGKVQPLDCPSCGSSVRFVPGLTRQIVCPSCRAQVDTTAKVAQVLDAAHRMQKADTTLQLGAKATIGGSAYEAIGVMRRKDEDGEVWTEYLLYSPRGGFLWLVETGDGWFSAKAPDDWPAWDGGDTARLGAQTFRKEYDYIATVVFAAGAFNWKVHAGDTARVMEFAFGKKSLAAELTNDELSWSLSTPVPADQLRAWFGTAIQADRLPQKTPIRKIAEYLIYALAALNIGPLLAGSDGAWTYFLFAAAAIYLPAMVLSWMGEDS